MFNFSLEADDDRIIKNNNSESDANGFSIPSHCCTFFFFLSTTIG